MNAGKRRHGWLLFRVLVSLLLLGVVLLYAGVDEIARAVRDGNWAWFAAAVALMGISSIFGAVRWRMLLQHAHIDVSELRAVRIFAAGLFLNNLLPSAFGGDAVRAWLVGRKIGRLTQATTATIVDRVTALACLLFVAWGALAVDGASVPNAVISVLGWVTLGIVAFLAVAALAAAGGRPVVRRLPDRTATMIREAWTALRGWAGSRRLLAWLFGLGLVYQGLGVLVIVLVGKTVGVDVSFPLAAAVTPVVLVAMLVPVTIGGIGVREGGFVLLLGEAGIGAADATVVSLLSAATILLSSATLVALTAGYEAVRIRETVARPLPRRPSG
jgi:glycosyltransferase 2 family protein